ncbi:2Fe-2S iron-sulfur cluster-binding protein [Undibacterium squillarum]|uniref:Ferredoxin n=1 Tax=Undibacterium squillarum TaxID=1131567 RepID=A0ABQ2Y1V2_9BURK|nr:2Fe-2S iron-sulfur cluster-binding protein [Undibacterium squillarum]GGX50776.1 ferredoxin [Undibacterium squillarum]
MQIQENPDTHQVMLLPSGLHFGVQEGETVLLAALRQHITMPSSCRNGTCRACMCRKQAGEVRYLIDWPGLSPDEKAEGWILPCVATPLTALALQVPLAKRKSPA